MAYLSASTMATISKMLRWHPRQTKTKLTQLAVRGLGGGGTGEGEGGMGREGVRIEDGGLIEGNGERER